MLNCAVVSFPNLMVASKWTETCSYNYLTQQEYGKLGEIRGSQLMFIFSYLWQILKGSHPDVNILGKSTKSKGVHINVYGFGELRQGVWVRNRLVQEILTN